MSTYPLIARKGVTQEQRNMVDINLSETSPIFAVQQQPGESFFGAWLRGLDAAPNNHCGPIYIR